MFTNLSSNIYPFSPAGAIQQATRQMLNGMSQSNRFLDHGDSDVSENEGASGYDSEAAEISRTERRGIKRRKLSHSSDSANSDDDIDGDVKARNTKINTQNGIHKNQTPSALVQTVHPGSKVHSAEGPIQEPLDDEHNVAGHETDYTVKPPSSALSNPASKSETTKKKKKTPGVIYLSSVPPYLKPSALRNLLAQRGFEPITRLFLAPSSKHKHSSKKNSRQLYSEGWIEFASKKTAKHCAEALNAQLIGGKKGGFYHDDLWNMKYLRGMSWEELMSGIREEKREEEGRRDEERRRVAKETEAFVRGVEKSKQLEGMKRKRQKKENEGVGAGDSEDKRMDWKQHALADGTKQRKKGDFNPEVKQVLAKIF